jgi:hypothetical protein
MDRDTSPFWTVEEFAAYMKITTGAARAMIRRDQVPSHVIRRIGRRIRLISALAREWFEKQSA